MIDDVEADARSDGVAAPLPSSSPLPSPSPSPDDRLAGLFAAVGAAPRAHDFFALLRRIEGARPDLPRLGRALRPSQEPLRLGQEPSLDFAPAALEAFAPHPKGHAPRLGVRFFGLLGPQGPMPLHVTEAVRERLRAHKDPTLARFLDVFHHRLLALFYRAWAESQPTVQHDRPADDRYAAWLGALCGVDAADAARSALPRDALLHHAGLLGTRSRHPEGLAKLLASHFGVPVRVEEHVPQWLVIDRDDRTRLGFAWRNPERVRATQGRLGTTATCGSKRHDRQYRFRVVLGPLTLARYAGFLPGGRAWGALGAWVRQHTGFDLRWDVQLVLAQAEVPEPRLDRRVRLGVSAWIGRRAAERDRADLRLRPDTSFLLRPGARHA